MRTKHVFFFIYTTLLFLVMGAIAIFKMFPDDDSKEDGPGCCYVYFKYLTNISWTHQLLFYGASSIFFFDTKAFNLLLFVGYFPTLGITCFVFIMVNVVFQYSDLILQDSVEKYGLGLVVTMNSVFHGVTVFAIVGYAFGYYNEIIQIHRLFWDFNDKWWIRTIFVIYQSYSPLLLIFIYDQIVDPHTIYKANIPDWVGWAVGMGTLSVLAIIYVLVAKEKPINTPNSKHKMLN